LRIWPTNEEIYDAIRIGYKQATVFNKFLGIRLLENEIPTIFPILHDDEPNTSEIDESGNNLNNQLVDESWTGVAAEVAKIAQLVANDDNITFEEENNISKTEISFILDNETLIEDIVLPDQIEFDIELISQNNILNISNIIKLRELHNAFSRSEKPSQKFNYSELLNDDNNIDRNSANSIITEMLQNDNIEVNRSRISRWTGRRRIADVIPIPQNLIGV
jgi:hypothetical protein